MEYRRRRRSIHAPRRKNTLLGAALCILLVSAAVIYLVGVSSAGTWLAENVVAPVFRTLGVGNSQSGKPSATDDGQSTSAAVSSELLELPQLACYALQMGVYATQENAEKQAIALQGVGAGGYILQDGDRYRVLAAAYTSDEDLQKVRQQLSTEGLDSASYVLSSIKSKLIVTGTEDQIATLERALKGLITLQGELSDLAIAFDRDQSSIAEGKGSITAAAQRVSGYLTEISAVSADQAILASLSDCCRDFLAQLSKADTMSEDDRAGFTAYLKYTCLLCAHAYCSFCTAVSALGSA